MARSARDGIGASDVCAAAGASGKGAHINNDLSPSDVERLLAGFLTGAVGVQLGTRLTDLNALPAECCKHVRAAEAGGRTWAAWATDCGPIAAWGDHHPEASKRLYGYQLLVEWWDVPTGHHSLWCYCDPKRPTEWTFGRGRHGAAP
jgi:hypothetical protein